MKQPDYNEIDQIVAVKFRWLRQMNGMTQAEMAELLGTRRARISELENGKTRHLYREIAFLNTK